MNTNTHMGLQLQVSPELPVFILKFISGYNHMIKLPFNPVLAAEHMAATSLHLVYRADSLQIQTKPASMWTQSPSDQRRVDFYMLRRHECRSAAFCIEGNIQLSQRSRQQPSAISFLQSAGSSSSCSRMQRGEGSRERLQC